MLTTWSLIWAVVQKVDTGARCVGPGANSLDRREGEHRRDPELGGFDFRVEYMTDKYAEQRGVEEILYNRYSAAMHNKTPRYLNGISESRGIVIQRWPS